MKPGHQAIFASWCAAHDLPPPTFELKFHDTRKWRFDACWPEHMVALEIEGGVFMKGGGRHNRGAGFRKDLEKYNSATADGWRVIRVLPEQLHTQHTVDFLRGAIESGVTHQGDTP